MQAMVTAVVVLKNSLSIWAGLRINFELPTINQLKKPGYKLMAFLTLIAMCLLSDWNSSTPRLD